jgi:hypothetical protein
MIKFINLFLTFSLLIAFSPKDSFSSCHDMGMSKGDHEHPCHVETNAQESQSDSEHTSDDSNECAMACCHLALENSNNYFIAKQLVGFKVIKVFRILNQSVHDFKSILFRPPIA